MAKDRNTFAKRQRETQRKQKADEKRERRVKRKQESARGAEPDRAIGLDQPLGHAADAATMLPESHQAVLLVFRRFRMTSGQMLCFSRADVGTFHAPLEELAEMELLVAEKFAGGYSLTPKGFAAMQTLP